MNKCCVKVVILLVFSLYTHAGRPEFPEELVDVIEHLHNVCRDQSGTTEEDISNCEKGIFKDDKKLKCYMWCLLEEGNFADENGVVDYDMLVSLIPEQWKQQVKGMLDACTKHDVPGKDRCECAFLVHKCLYEQNPELYFLF